MASNQPKQMSSRLATMKFMQRSVANKVATPPATPEGRSSKRVRLSTGGESSPATPSDHEVIQAALAAEEQKRQDALEKQAAAAGETKWVLSFKDPDEVHKKPTPMRVVTAGFAVLDADETDESEEDPGPVGRMTFGKVAKPSAKPSAQSDSDSESDSSEEDEDSDDPAGQLIRQEARKAKKASKREAQTPVSKAKNRYEVDLDQITTISGSGGSSNKRPPPTCYNCRKIGHMSKDCPQKSGNKGGNRNGGYQGGRR
ncbi:hypothetical protein GQ43DRAFT_438515 [Delitschia confertaspora ATCC 74209]|uniref:CCHC-type domain-containing protein n=1 Tax=Delitschia confertaspora ATCC 74209 TaxID=1513339 RepID=A0A9P4JSW4_9PLEO|nr:hypothetical protein GQ43DRAFT_438515 [Delitschia confertaspora ATCC 74209]